MKDFAIAVDFFEASLLLSAEPMRKLVGDTAEGVFTTALPLTLGKTGEDFKEKYEEVYGEEPFFPAIFSYDIVKLVAKASDGKSLSADVLTKNILALKTFEGVNGPVTIQGNGEINPSMYEAQIIGGKLVAV